MIGLDQLQVLRSYPTTSGFRVELARTGDGDLVIVKTAKDPARTGTLVAQSRQMRVIAQTFDGSVFPTVLASTPGRLITAYAHGSAIRDVGNALSPEDTTATLVNAVARVFELSATLGDGPPGLGFLTSEVHRRAARVAQAVSRRGLRLPDSVGRVCAMVAGWEELLAPPRLGVGVHGDLTPQNIIYNAETGRATLIDPRGLVRWKDEHPWWDPAFDLGAVVAFHAVVNSLPGLDPSSAAHRADELYAHIVDHCADRVGAWTKTDPAWPHRGRVAVLARILGNVSVQLHHFPADGARRAQLLLDTCSLLADSVIGEIHQLRTAT